MSAATDSLVDEVRSALLDLHEHMAQMILRRPWGSTFREHALERARAEANEDLCEALATLADGSAAPTPEAAARTGWLEALADDLCHATLDAATHAAMSDAERADLDTWRAQVRAVRARLVPLGEEQAAAIAETYRPALRAYAHAAALRAVPLCIRWFSPSFGMRFEPLCAWRMKIAIAAALDTAAPIWPSVAASVEFASAWAQHRAARHDFDVLLEEQRAPLQSALESILAIWQKSHDASTAPEDRIDFASYARVAATPPGDHEQTTWEMVLESSVHDAVLHVFMDGWRCTQVITTG